MVKKLISQTALFKLFMSELFARAAYSKKRIYELKPLESLTSGSKFAFQPNTLAVVHVFYLDQVHELLSKVLGLTSLAAVVVTTTSEEVRSACEVFGSRFKVPFTVIQGPNRGRNFGPLFELMALEHNRYEFLLHVHGKKSLHTSRRRTALWTEALYSNLLRASNLEAILSHMEADRSVCIAYPNVSRFVSKFNMCWGPSFEPIREIALKLGIARPRFLTSRLNFPAGGMFVLRLDAYRNLFDAGITKLSFTEEHGGIDGLLEHGLERLFGALADTSGMSQLALGFETNNHVKITCRG